MPKRRVLILDDEEAVGQTIQWIAEGLGFEVAFTTHASEFFSLLDSTAPDILTIDLAMPELDGVEILGLLARRKCSARIVISSGMGARILDAAQRSAAGHGLSIAGVLSKPISRDAFRTLVGQGSDSTNSVAAQYLSVRHDTLEVTGEELRTALDRRELTVVYQPKIDCKTGAAAGFEALVRWQDPGRGRVMPDDFIPVAEESSFIDALTTQVFEQSLEWFSRAFPDSPLTLSLNLSAKSLVSLQLADNLAALCGRFQIPTNRIVLELTETSAMIDPVLSLDLLTRLRVKGFRLSIDDFGTGYSSMVQLVRMPFSEIKIDKSFVLHVQDSAEARAVIKSIVDLGHSLGLVVVAEGVENRETLNYLNSVGCDLAQGYLIAPPLSGDAACKWTRQCQLQSPS
jgi:EAL domain-containing protein (putative c-di-GMP-specific phosphodiesterase class I)